MTRDELAIAMTAAPAPGGVTLRVKVVPGSSRDRITGMLGDRLKVAVAAPPEDGKANKAVCQLLATTLRVPPRDVTITEGHTRPLKSVTILGLTFDEALDRLLSKA